MRTAWVKPPSLSGGLDHIGIQQLPIRIFSTLLPGITVVTDRVANYSFYPWVSWVHHEEGEALGLDFIHFLRRAECLNTLIAERHTQVTGDDERLHSRGLVGRNSLTRLVQSDELRPIDFAALAELRDDNPDSYFKNRFGGLGQYYLGPLRDLGVLQRIGDRVEVSEDVGLPLARAFDERVDRGAFLEVLSRGTASEADLDALAAFCPCHLAGNETERELLLDLLLARQGEAAEGDVLRRETLLLLLDLAQQRPEATLIALDEAFKAASLTGATDAGEPWTVPEAQQPVVNAWAAYERNDLLSIGALGVFWVALHLLEERDGAAAHSGEVGAWVTELAQETLGDLGSLPLEEAVRKTAEELPPLRDWLDASHEFQVAGTIREAARRSGDEPEACLRASATVLLALAARHGSSHPYVEARIPGDYLRDYPLNLNSFFASLDTHWAGLTVAEWLGELAATWGIEAHLRVALRKLHHESKDTFLVRMTDDGLRMPLDKTPPLPSFTASRLNRAVQFAVDLGLASWEVAHDDADAQEGEDEDGDGPLRARISEFGSQVLGALRG